MFIKMILLNEHVFGNNLNFIGIMYERLRNCVAYIFKKPIFNITLFFLNITLHTHMLTVKYILSASIINAHFILNTSLAIANQIQYINIHRCIHAHTHTHTHTHIFIYIINKKYKVMKAT